MEHRDHIAERAWNRPTVWGVSAISGTSTIAPRPAGAPPRPPAGRPGSCPSRSRRGAGTAPRHRGLARGAGAGVERAEDGVERGALFARQFRGARAASDRHRGRAPRPERVERTSTRPRPSSRLSVGVPSAAAVVARRAGAPRARPAGDPSGERLPRPRRRRRRSARPPAPAFASRRLRSGAITRLSARADVEQYSAAIHRERHQVGRHARGQHGVGLGQAFGRQLGFGGQTDTTPSVLRPPKGTRKSAPTLTSGLLGAQAVVERAA